MYTRAMAVDTLTEEVLCDTWLRLNEPYTANGFYGTAKPGSVDYYDDGGTTILLTAPHAVRHARGNSDKKNDARTGGLCRLLYEQARVSTLIASGYVPAWLSWESRHDPFKSKLTQAAAFSKAMINLLRDLAR